MFEREAIAANLGRWVPVGKYKWSPEMRDHVEALAERLERRPQPVELPPDLVRRTGERRDLPEPVPGIAQIPVRYAYDETLERDCEVLAVTRGGAVKIRAVLHPGTAPTEVWVWRNAVVPKGAGDDGR